MGTHQTRHSGGRAEKEKEELDRSHTEKNQHNNKQTGADMMEHKANRGRGRPKNHLEKEHRTRSLEEGTDGKQLERKAHDRRGWKKVILQVNNQKMMGRKSACPK